MTGSGLNYGVASDAASIEPDLKDDTTAKKSMELHEAPQEMRDQQDADVAQPDEAQQIEKAKRELESLYLQKYQR